MQNYQIIMFLGDAVVDGSRQVVGGEDELDKARKFAEKHGYEFSYEKTDKDYPV